MALVNAVRDADAGSSYPDYYTGESMRESDYPPARTRHHKIKPYQDLDNPAVPAFTLTHDQLLRSMRQFGPGGGFMGYMGTHVVEMNYRQTQTINLYNKRTAGDKYWPPTTKKLKTSAPQSTMTKDNMVIDLTQDDSLSSQNPPVLSMSNAPGGNVIYPFRHKMVSSTNPTRYPPSSEPPLLGGRTLPRAQARADNRERETHLQTAKALDTISNILSVQLTQIANAREKLRKRWDMDQHLQLQTVTDDLVELNKRFGIIEDAETDAIHLIKNRLRGHRGLI